MQAFCPGIAGVPPPRGQDGHATVESIHSRPSFFPGDPEVFLDQPDTGREGSNEDCAILQFY